MAYKKIWIINQYGSLPSTGVGGRHRHLSRELSHLGHRVTLFSAAWTHLDRDDVDVESLPEEEVFEGFRFLRIPTSKYKHAHDKKRVLSWFSFAWRIRGLAKKLREKPDVIIYSSPAPIGYLTACFLARKYHAKLVFEVRDIWPLSLVQLGGFSPSHPFIRFMQWIEDLAYQKSDGVISNLEGAVEHAKARGLSPEKFAWIPNGFSREELDQLEAAPPEMTETMKRQPFSVTYAGAIGEANSLYTLIDAADLLRDRDDIYFNIVGRGRLTDELQEIVQRREIVNVRFWDAVPKAQVQSVLRASSACVICWRDSVLYKHGLAANKLFDYLYSGRPVINAYSGGYDIIQRYKAGLTVPAESPKKLAGAIRTLADSTPEKLSDFGGRGKKAALEHHEYGAIADKLNRMIQGL